MLDWSIKLFRVCGIRLELHITFMLLVVYFGMEGLKAGGWNGAVWGVLFLCIIFACVTMHELGHSLMARQFGIKTSRILLMPIGGLAQFERMPDTPQREAVVTLAGPAVNFALFALLLPFVELESVVTLPRGPGQLLSTTALFNLIMGLFNLIPVFPMDGGRLLRALLSLRLSHLRSTTIASRIGSVLAAALAAFSLINAQPLAAALFLFILFASHLELQAVRRRALLENLPARAFADSNYLALSHEATLLDATRALRHKQPKDILLLAAGQLVGLLDLNRLDKALKNSARYPLSTPLLDIAATRFSVLQADDPIERVYELAPRAKQRTFPVFQYATLIGTVTTDTIDERAYWIRRSDAFSDAYAQTP